MTEIVRVVETSSMTLRKIFNGVIKIDSNFLLKLAMMHFVVLQHNRLATFQEALYDVCYRLA